MELSSLGLGLGSLRGRRKDTAQPIDFHILFSRPWAFHGKINFEYVPSQNSEEVATPCWIRLGLSRHDNELIHNGFSKNRQQTSEPSFALCMHKHTHTTHATQGYYELRLQLSIEKSLPFRYLYQPTVTVGRCYHTNLALAERQQRRRRTPTPAGELRRPYCAAR